MGLSLSIGLGLTAPRKGGGYRFVNAEAAALVARFATPADNDRKALIDGRFTAGKAKSFWAKLDALWVHAAHGAEAGRLNWLGDIYNCIPVNNPAFTVDRGYLGNGSSSYLDTQFNPSTAVGANYALNSASFGIRSNTDNTGTGSLAGYYDTGGAVGSTINPRINVSNDALFRVNQGSTGSTASGGSPSGVGMFAASRTGASAIKGYRNGSVIISSSLSSSSIANGNLRLGSINSSSYRACQFSMGWVGGGFTDQEVQDIYDWFEPYRIAVGVT